MRNKWRGYVTVAAVSAVLSGGTAGSAAAKNVVVAPGGTVAGMSYGQWLAISWQLALAAQAPGPAACSSANTADGTVAVLFQSFAGGIQSYTCHEPADRPLYVVGISNECSTVPGDHAGFGDTPAQLELCAPSGYAAFGAFGTAAVDGTPVDDYRALISRTTVFAIHLPRDNVFGVPEQNGQSAAYGEGLLLRGLSRGTHIVHTTSVVPGALNADVTYTLHIG